jgi:hypothetical protein
VRLHIDGDILLFRCGFAAEKGEYILTYVNKHEDEVDEAYTYRKDLDNRIGNLGLRNGYSVVFNRRAEPVENALHNVRTVIRKIEEELESDDLRVYLSGTGNFREKVAVTRKYKGNRDKAHRPTHEQAIKDYLIKKYNAIVSEGEEADDVIGYSHYELWEQDPFSSVIVSTDKDLDMIPGLHYNFVNKELYNVDLEYANRRFYRQLLTGDSTDNIVGLPKVGPVKADRILGDEHEEPYMYKAVQNAYGDDEYLLENARLIWIRRHKEEMWMPPSESK